MTRRRRTAGATRIFDTSGTVPLPRWTDRAGEVAALVRDVSRFTGRVPPPTGLSRGDGHVVLVFPALFSSDYLTRGFRRLLTDLGYSVEGWGAGINLGPTEAAWRIPDDRLVALAARSGRPVSLVGHSLGGVLARALAYRHPGLVRRVITICSPFRLPTASRLEPAYRLFSRWHIDEELLLSRIAERPPVPTTAIYSPRDGIVAWTSCVDPPGPGSDNVAVNGRHSTMLSNPEAIRIVADRLARPVPAEAAAVSISYT
jgi:pimeloyl-ACP methyl ester carboxylesterase